MLRFYGYGKLNTREKNGFTETVVEIQRPSGVSTVPLWFPDDLTPPPIGRTVFMEGSVFTNKNGFTTLAVSNWRTLDGKLHSTRIPQQGQRRQQSPATCDPEGDGWVPAPGPGAPPPRQPIGGAASPRAQKTDSEPVPATDSDEIPF